MTEIPETVLDGARWMAREIGAYVFAVDHPDLPTCAGLKTLGHLPSACTQRGKHPCVRPTIEATNADREIVAMFAGTTRNYGIFTRQSGLIVLDVDEPGALEAYLAEIQRELPQTFEVTTGRAAGGVHYYFTVPRGADIGNADLCPGVNVRASAAGYVVGPGSRHVSGVDYRATWDRRPRPAPDWLLETLAERKRAASAPPVEAVPLDRPVPDNILSLLAGAVVDRSETFYRLVAELRDAGFGQGHAVTVLAPWCAQHGKYVGRVAAEVARAWGKLGGHQQGHTQLATSAARVTLDDTCAVFTRWLGAEYDLGALDVVLATAAAEQLPGDPPWLLVVGGSGNAKTETVSALLGAGAHVTSTVSSEGALLSATPVKDKAKGATGGLLRKVGDRGIVVVKDFTSILSMNRDMRAAVLAALREVYDGRWERNVGTDGGRTLTWVGRLVFIAAVTTAWDTHHGVVAAMGDRFALVRIGSTTGRLVAGRQALGNVGQETAMRAELATAVGGVLAGLNRSLAARGDEDTDELLRLADLVTYARTAVERDFKGDVIDAHAPEMPTRFAKTLEQIVRGGLALGMSRDRAMAAAVRVAGDSMPPLRLAVLADVGEHSGSRTSEVRARLQRPRSTVDRELQALHVLGLLVQYGSEGMAWQYDLSGAVDRDVLKRLVTRKVSTGDTGIQKEEPPPFLLTDIPGDAWLTGGAA